MVFSCHRFFSWCPRRLVDGNVGFAARVSRANSASNTNGLKAQMVRFLATPTCEEPYVAGMRSRSRLNGLHSTLDVQLSRLSGEAGGRDSDKDGL